VSLDYDYHVHSNYSDGRFLSEMLGAAADAGLSGVGVADHCTVADREPVRTYRARYGFNLDVTHERRRAAIDSYRDAHDLAVWDAVEMDYDPRDEAAIGEFLAEAGFDYAVGSVHELDGHNVHDAAHFGGKAESERRRLVGRYYEKLVALVDSGLFDVVAHPDLVERNPALRGLSTRDQYEAVAAALADADAVPEVNAGRALDDYGEFHPSPAFLATLAAHDVPVVPGTDSHAPGEVRERVPALAARLADAGVETTTLALD
jgi:histidinol-phosphatase (PHP family)